MTTTNVRKTAAVWAAALTLWSTTPLVDAAVNVQASTFEVLTHLDPNVCQTPSSALVLAADGNFYGTLSTGGTQYGGCLYRVTPKGKFTVLHEFSYAPGEGAIPYGGLQLSPDGSLLGSTMSGGPGAAGTLFQASVNGHITYLRKFGDDPMGFSGPSGAPIRASDGRLYGTLLTGGSNQAGAVYSVKEDGSDFRVHHEFGTGAGELYSPAGMLLQGSDGALYGALVSGPGGIYRLRLDGDYRVLHTMNAVGDGTDPQGGVIQLADGTLYGTNTACGGDGNWCDRGTIFRLSAGKNKTAPTKFKVLFTGNELSIGPHSLAAGLTLQADGSLWSTSTFGGAGGGFGTVYRFTPQGDMTVMHSFYGPDGGYPHWGLTPGPDGWLYGVTQQGGDLGGGVIFRIKPN